MEILLIFIAAIIGFIIGYLITNLNYKKKSFIEMIALNENQKKIEADNVKLNSKIEALENEKEHLKCEMNEWKEKYDNKVIELQLTKESLVLAQNELKHLNEKLELQKLEIEEIQEKFKSEFENLANKIFEEKSEKFVNINKMNLTDILSSFKEKIEHFEKKVEETYESEYREKIKLETEIHKLYELSSKMNEEASNLTKALKGNVKMMGNWGEMILENILEKSGLELNREFFKQESIKSTDGSRYQPDFIIKLPEKRNIIIDSKVSLIAYEKFQNSEDKEEQKKYLNEHINSIKSHIDGLSKKNYQDLYDIKSIDYVFMFIPIEPAFLIAIQKDTTLWEYAYSKKILLISPTNMIAVLKIIYQIWQQEKQNNNAFEIAKQASDLYDKFVGFVEDLQKIGENIAKAQTSYNTALNKLIDGKGNLINKVEKIKQLGITPKKQIPQELIKDVEE